MNPVLFKLYRYYYSYNTVQYHVLNKYIFVTTCINPVKRHYHFLIWAIWPLSLQKSLNINCLIFFRWAGQQVSPPWHGTNIQRIIEQSQRVCKKLIWSTCVPCSCSLGYRSYVGTLLLRTNTIVRERNHAGHLIIIVIQGFIFGRGAEKQNSQQ